MACTKAVLITLAPSAGRASGAAGATSIFERVGISSSPPEWTCSNMTAPIPVMSARRNRNRALEDSQWAQWERIAEFYRSFSRHE
jgi:hypothetical protein